VLDKKLNIRTKHTDEFWIVTGVCNACGLCGPVLSADSCGGEYDYRVHICKLCIDRAFEQWIDETYG